MSLLRRLFGKPSYPQVPYQITTRELIQKEAKVGASLFGFVGPKKRREFFMLDDHTWVWYEEWKDGRGLHRVTTRYEIHGDNVLKIQNDGPAHMVDHDELNNFCQAVEAYHRAVADQVYHRPVTQ